MFEGAALNRGLAPVSAQRSATPQPAAKDSLPMPEDVHSIAAEIPVLRRYAQTLTRDRSSADDLVQDAVTRSIEKFHLYQPDTRLRSCLFAIMLNVFRD